MSRCLCAGAGGVSLKPDGMLPPLVLELAEAAFFADFVGALFRIVPFFAHFKQVVLPASVQTKLPKQKHMSLLCVSVNRMHVYSPHLGCVTCSIVGILFSPSKGTRNSRTIKITSYKNSDYFSNLF